MISLSKQNKGFTIVELLIVIVVIGILAGLVITTYNGIQQKARNTERTTDLKTFQSQLEAYYAQNARYPSTATGGNGLGTDSAGNVSFIQANLKGMDKETLRDPKGSDFSLATTATSSKYAYTPAPTGCDNGSGGDCTSYTLTAKPEGSGADIVLNSLN